MRVFLITALAVAMVFGAGFVTDNEAVAQTCTGNGNKFVDLDGDGFNDNAPDADGDGIPNGLDPDYIKHSQDGDCKNEDAPDADGDGIPNGQDEDYVPNSQDGEGYQHRFQTAGEDGTANAWQQFHQARIATQSASMIRNEYNHKGTFEGNGEDAGAKNGSGTCDGTGPKGKQTGK